MIASLLFLLALQQHAAGPTVMVSVDRDRVAPGDMLRYTIRVSSDLPDQIRVDLPSLGGFELESRAERSDVAKGGGGRTTWIQLDLRATTPGEWRLGPVNVRQGIATAQADPVTVTIDGGMAVPVNASLSSRVAKIIQRAPPPGVLGPAGITVAISEWNVPVGQQVDVITIAWFERGLRQQLRRAPTVESPRIEGVWSYPQPVPGGIAATRQVGGKWYDLFVLHQVVFPLTPGRVAVSPARLQYSVPLAYQFFSQEEAYKLESESSSFTAEALPAAGRDPGFSGAVGHDLTLSQTLTPTAGKQGEAFAAEISVRGEGNVALWPQPDVRWPPGFRVYPEAAREELAMREGRLTGAKTFKFMLVADSAGAMALPTLRYPYYDLDDQRYRLASGPSAMVIVAPRGESVASRAEPPPIRLERRLPVARALQESLPAPVWWLIAIAPVLAFVMMRRPRRARTEAAAEPTGDPLALAEHRLSVLLAQGNLAPPDTDTVRGLLERVQSARYGGQGRGGSRELTLLVEQALGRVTTRGVAGRRRARERAGLVTMLLVTAAAQGVAQTQPEEFYNAGAYRGAEEGFRRRALLEPDIPTHWFNLGDAAYRAGDDAEALAAWVRAARLSPRDGGIRRALLLVAPADQNATDELWVSPITPPELWLLGLVAWIGGWAGILWSRQIRGRWTVLLAGGAVLAGLGAGLSHWYRAPVAIAGVNEQLRLSPHELAPAVGEVARLGTVRLGPARGVWVQVEVGGQRGWMPRERLEPLAGTFAR